MQAGQAQLTAVVSDRLRAFLQRREYRQHTSTHQPLIGRRVLLDPISIFQPNGTAYVHVQQLDDRGKPTGNKIPICVRVLDLDPAAQIWYEAWRRENIPTAVR